MSVEETLKERGANYGDYMRGVKARANIMAIMNQVHNEEHGCDIPEMYMGAIWDVVNKLCRIAVTPPHIDSWHDIQGYAKLTEDALRRTQDAQPQ